MPSPVNKRASLPGASELFRGAPGSEPAKKPAAPPRRAAETGVSASGRVKHDQKITVYFSSDELFALEEGTLGVRRLAGRSLDRGRVVRTAVALALADLEENGEESALVRALLDE